MEKQIGSTNMTCPAPPQIPFGIGLWKWRRGGWEVAEKERHKGVIKISGSIYSKGRGFTSVPVPGSIFEAL